MMSLLGHALSDVANQVMLGCEPLKFGSDQMWPQLIDVARAGRADYVLRVENLKKDSLRFEAELASQGKLLPPAKEGCSVAEIEGSEASNHGYSMLEPGLANFAMAKEIMQKSPALQRRMCALYYHDLVCGGYELPEACTAPVETWFDQSMKELLNDSPLPAL